MTNSSAVAGHFVGTDVQICSTVSVMSHYKEGVLCLFVVLVATGRCSCSGQHAKLVTVMVVITIDNHHACCCAQVVLRGVSMRENTAIGGTGGAVGVWGNATVTAAGSCLVANNSAYGGAGFDLNDYSNTTLLEVMFVNNTVQGNGSGVYAGNYAQVRCSCLQLPTKCRSFI